MSKKDVICMFSRFGIPEDKIHEAVRTWMKVELIMRTADTEGAADVFCGDEEDELRSERECMERVMAEGFSHCEHTTAHQVMEHMLKCLKHKTGKKEEEKK